MRRSETNTLLFESESGNMSLSRMGSVLFGASICQTKICFFLTGSVCSPKFYCCPEQLSSCIVPSQDHRDMGWKGSLEAIWSSLYLQV